MPNIPGLESFEGDWYHTGGWPHEKVDFTGKRVAVIGTGSSGVQAIPVIAEQAERLTVFQRTPQYTIPARHENVDTRFIEEDVKPHYDEIWEKARWSKAGFPADFSELSALEVSAEERQQTYETLWDKGGTTFLYGTFKDIRTDRRANDTAAEFIRSKIRETVRDPETTEKLLPVDHPFGSKRTLIDTNYFETYNRENVELVDIRHSPIEEITAKGIRTEDEEFEFDIIVFATGFGRDDGHFSEDGHSRQKRSVTQGEVGGRTEDLSWSAGRRLPEHVHDYGARQSVGAQQHASVHRAAHRMDIRLHRFPSRTGH